MFRIVFDYQKYTLNYVPLKKSIRIRRETGKRIYAVSIVF